MKILGYLILPNNSYWNSVLALAALHLGENPGIHCIKGWVGPRASVDEVGGEIISLTLPGFEAQTVQSEASHYTE